MKFSEEDKYRHKLIRMSYYFKKAWKFLQNMEKDLFFVDFGNRSDWYFRGHGHESWKLLPGAYRRDGVKKLASICNDVELIKNNYKFKEKQEYEIQMHREMLEKLSLALFYRQVDRNNFIIPSLSQRAHLSLSLPSDELSEDNLPFALEDQWPSHDILPLMAVAQHYGLPTRLLDLTESPFVAAYFAAKYALDLVVDHPRSKNKPRYVVIWAIKTTKLYDPSINGTPYKSYMTYKPQRINNSNLSAQEGAFMIGPDLSNLNSEPKYGIENIMNEDMFRILLPITEVVELLELLEDMRIDYCHLFPHLSSVSYYIEDKTIRYQKFRKMIRDKKIVTPPKPLCQYQIDWPLRDD